MTWAPNGQTGDTQKKDQTKHSGISRDGDMDPITGPKAEKK
jgi:hypothetical protein